MARGSASNHSTQPLLRAVSVNPGDKPQVVCRTLGEGPNLKFTRERGLYKELRRVAVSLDDAPEAELLRLEVEELTGAVWAALVRGAGKASGVPETGGYLLVRESARGNRELILQARSGAVSIHRLERDSADLLDQWLLSRRSKS